MPIAADSVPTIVRSRYDIGDILSVQRLEGGEWKTLYRLETTRGQFVLSLCHPSATVESVEWEHAFLRYLAPHLPQVASPIAACDGQTYFVHADRIASLLPFMPGQIADAADIRPQAAQMLAEYHRAAHDYPAHKPRPGIPALHTWDWDNNHAWRWSAVEALLISTPNTTPRFWRDGGSYVQEIVSRRRQIEEERTACRRWVTQLVQSQRQMVFAPIHGDFYERNLLVQDGVITALLDWDGCHPDWLLLDLSNAVWEFCRSSDEHTLDLPRAHEFIRAYRDADGPIERAELDMLTPFIRFRMLLEALSGLQNVINGEPWNEDFAAYTLHNLRSLESLQMMAGEKFDA